MWEQMVLEVFTRGAGFHTDLAVGVNSALNLMMIFKGLDSDHTLSPFIRFIFSTKLFHEHPFYVC